jgi:DNA-binding response OmpR family regulator
MNILVVEDDPDLSRLLSNVLTSEGFAVTTAIDGELAVKMHRAYPADFIILDLMLPRMDGFSVLDSLRSANDHTPVLLLTARGSVSDRVKGLAMGADDYMVKPFSTLELVERVKAIARRSHLNKPDAALVSGPIRIDITAMNVFVDEVQVELTSKEFQILRLLVERSGNTIARSELLKLAWEPEARPTARTVDTHVSRIRRKIGDNEVRGWIKTIGSQGYRWCLSCRSDA